MDQRIAWRDIAPHDVTCISWGDTKMQNTNDLLDAIKARHHLTSDYALSRKLDISRQRISNYRAKRYSIDETLYFRVAELLDIDPAEVAAIVSAERARDAEVKRMWLRVAAKFHAATVCFFAIFSIYLMRAEHLAQCYKYILCKIDAIRHFRANLQKGRHFSVYCFKGSLFNVLVPVSC